MHCACGQHALHSACTHAPVLSPPYLAVWSTTVFSLDASQQDYSNVTVCRMKEELRELCLQNSHPVAELNPIQSDTLYTAFRNDSCGPSAIASLGRKPQWWPKNVVSNSSWWRCIWQTRPSTTSVALEPVTLPGLKASSWLHLGVQSSLALVHDSYKGRRSSAKDRQPACAVQSGVRVHLYTRIWWFATQ